MEDMPTAFSSFKKANRDQTRVTKQQWNKSARLLLVNANTIASEYLNGSGQFVYFFILKSPLV